MADVPVDQALVLVLSKLAPLPLGPLKQQLKRTLITEALAAGAPPPKTSSEPFLQQRNLPSKATISVGPRLKPANAACKEEASMVAPSSSSSSLNEPTKSIERISHRSSKCWPGGAPRSPRPPKPLPPSPPPQAPPPSSHDMSAEVSEMISIMTSSSSAPQAAGAATLKDAKREAMASLAPRTSAARTSKHHTDDKPIPKSKPPATSSTKASPQQRHWPPSRSPRPPRRAPPSPPQETPQLLSPTTVENAGVPSSPPRGTASLNLAAALAKDNAMNDSVIAALAKSPFETSSNPNPSGTSGNSGALAPSGTNTSSSRKSSSSSRGTTTSNSRGNITRLPMHPREQARAMESLLRLPENVAAAKEKRNAATTSSRSANKAAPTNAAPIVPVSLLRRNQRFQIGFLESLQALKRGTSVTIDGEHSYLKLSETGLELQWEPAEGASYAKKSTSRGTAALDHPSLVVHVSLMRREENGNRSPSCQKEAGDPSYVLENQSHSLQLVERHSIHDEDKEDGEKEKEKVVALSPVFEFGCNDNASRNALMWGSTLASVHFAHWWQHTQSTAKIPSPSNTTNEAQKNSAAQKETSPAATSSLPPRTRPQFRQSSYNNSSSSSIENSSTTAAVAAAAAQRPLHLWQAARVALAELTSSETETAASSSSCSSAVTSALEAWDAITRCVAEARLNATATPWELPLDIKAR